MALETRPPGKLATTNITNELVRALNGSGSMETGLVSLPFGITNALIGQVLPQGPNGEPDFTDNRYWVRCCATKVQPLFAGPNDHPEVGVANGELAEMGPTQIMKGETVIVTNLAEQWGYPFSLSVPGTGNEPVSFPGPHTVPHGSFIQFGVTVDHGDLAVVKFRYVTFTVPKLQSLIEVTAYDIGAGVYYGVECNAPTNDIPGNANVTMVGVIGKQNPFTCRIVNFNEMGTAGHAIDYNRHPRVFVGYLLRANFDGVPVYGANMYQEPVGQYQGMVRQMVTDLAVGFDRVRGHGLL